MGVDPGLAATGIAVVDHGVVIYRSTARTGTEESDPERCDELADAVLSAALDHAPDLVVVEGYQYQGARTQGRNALRMPLLIGWICGRLQTPPLLATRTEWGRALGAMQDAGQAAALAHLRGEKLRTAHERDAACLALYGAHLERVRTMGR